MANKNKQIEILPGEEWKIVEGYDHYEVSNFGRICSTAYGYPRLLKGQKDAMGYLHYRLHNGTDKVKLEKEHRLVAKAFLPVSDEGFKEVNHINGIKTDNRVENLEWVTRGENIRHAWKTGLHSPESIKQGGIKRRKLVKITYKDGREVFYKGLIAAAITLETTPHTLRKWTKKDGFCDAGYRVDYIKEIPIGEVFERLEHIEHLVTEYYKQWNLKYSKKKKK